MNAPSQRELFLLLNCAKLGVTRAPPVPPSQCAKSATKLYLADALLAAWEGLSDLVVGVSANGLIDGVLVLPGYWMQWQGPAFRCHLMGLRPETGEG